MSFLIAIACALFVGMITYFFLTYFWPAIPRTRRNTIIAAATIITLGVILLLTL